MDEWTDQPLGIITEADIAHAVADGKDLSSVRILDLMTIRPTVITTTTSVRDAAKTMTSGHFRHLPVPEPRSRAARPPATLGPGRRSDRPPRNAGTLGRLVSAHPAPPSRPIRVTV